LSQNLQIILSSGQQSPEKAVLAIAAALSAAHSGIDVSLVMAMRGAEWAAPSVGNDTAVDGYPPVATLLSELADGGGQVLACSSCVDQYCPALVGTDGEKVLRTEIKRIGLSVVAIRMAEWPTVTF
jgi:predicted peroxiredoxin